jgi:hypothetical protein
MPNNAATQVLFDNCLILAPDGQPTGRCEKKRIDWYLERGLADKVADDPITIKLKFEPSGRRGMKDPWTLLPKPNHCVVCGATEDLNRHHVVPWSFLRHMPNSHKKHNSHDVLPTCTSCHTKYEEESQKKRKHFSELYGIPLSGMKENFRDEMYVRGLARSLTEHGDKIPPGRIVVMKLLLQEALGHVPTDAEIKELAKLKPKPPSSGQGFGAQVMAQVKDFDEFAKFWRQHFLDTMKPKFMPDYWRVDRKFCEDYAVA